MTIDLHLDTLWKMTKYGYFSLTQGANYSAVSEEKLKRGGLTAGVLALYAAHHMECDAERVINEQIAFARRQKLRDFTVYLALEGGGLLLNSLQRLEQLAKEGIVYLTLTHNYNTSWADSATDKPYHNGLTTFGKEVVAVCNRLGVLVDVSHTSPATAEQAIVTSTKPVIASHSGCRALFDHPRNISDDLIKRIAVTGGLVGVPFVKNFIGKISAIPEHIDHIVQLVGINHVAVGSDIDGAVMVDGIDDVADWDIVYTSLLNLGYTESAIAQVAGENFQKLIGA